MPAKIDLYKSYGEKLIGLFVRLLFSGERYSLTELAEMFNCSKQTVLRLIDNVRKSYGITVEETRQGNRCYYRIKKPAASLRNIPLTEDELQALQLCKAFTQHLVGKKLFDEATQAIFKSNTTLAGGKHISACHFAAFSPGTIDYSPQHQIIHALIDAMQRQKICRLTYQAAGAPEPKTYHIKPLKLFSYHDAIYLHAQKAKEPGKPLAITTFDPLLAVHRMKSVDVTDIDFQPGKFDFEKTFNRHFGIIKEKAFTVEVEFAGWAASYVAERRWSPKQEIMNKDKDKIILKFMSSSEQELLGWILSFGENAVLIKPGWLVKKLKLKIGKLAGGYK